MRGFDTRWKDFPDYILGITREIWEDRGLGAKMKEYYAEDVIVRMPGGVSRGEAASTRATVETLHAFPDRVLLGEDVIWSGNPDAGMLSSHRILSTATHLGPGPFGEPSGKPVRYRAIADCWAKDNQIHDEWLIRDNGALLRQIGSTPEAWAEDKIRRGEQEQPLTPETEVEGPYTERGEPGEAGARLEAILTRMMSAEFSVIPAEYDRACELAYPGGIEAHGIAAADRFWLPLRASFPDAEFAVHHVIGRDADPMMPPRAAVRWSLWGGHDGWGPFGTPSGKRVHVLGITHAEFGPWGLRREWTLIDEAAIWLQIKADG